jgi:hypothetical protein
MTPLSGDEQNALKEQLKLLQGFCVEQARRIQAVEDFLLAHSATAPTFRKLPSGKTVEETERILQTSFEALERTLKGQFH